MAEKRNTRKKAARATTKKRIVSETKLVKKQRHSFLSDVFRFGESYTSLILGIIVVIAVASLLVTFSKTRTATPETPSTDISATRTEQPTDVASPGSTYVVREGDDLWQIAEEAYGDGHRFTEIVKANNIQDPNNLTAGTTLRIPTADTLGSASPTGSALTRTTVTVTLATTLTATPTLEPTRVPSVAPTTAVSEKPTTGSISGSRYTVKQGDTLWDISVRTYGNGYRWIEIARANNLQNPDLIHPGNTFVLPR